MLWEFGESRGEIINFFHDGKNTKHKIYPLHKLLGVESNAMDYYSGLKKKYILQCVTWMHLEDVMLSEMCCHGRVGAVWFHIYRREGSSLRLGLVPTAASSDPSHLCSGLSFPIQEHHIRAEPLWRPSALRNQLFSGTDHFFSRD